MPEKERMPAGKDNKEKKILQMAGISPEEAIIINLQRRLEVGRVVIIKIYGGIRPRMFYTGG